MKTIPPIEDEAVAATGEMASVVETGLDAGASVTRRLRNGIPLLPIGTPSLPATLERVNQLRDEP